MVKYPVEGKLGCEIDSLMIEREWIDNHAYKQPYSSFFTDPGSVKLASSVLV